MGRRKTTRTNRDRMLVLKYGITEDRYHQMLEDQDGLCAICGCIPTRLLVVDHDHETGEVRGLLCANCNTGIGFMRDSPWVLCRAAAYLDRHNTEVATRVRVARR